MVIILSNKTNAIRMAEKAGIQCKEVFYKYSKDDLSGTHAAKAVGLPERQVFKTLVTRGVKGGVYVFCIPVCCELDLKKAARAAGDKKVEMLPLKDLLPTTGYIRGGCSPIGMKKQYPTYIDESCMDHDFLSVSAGQRGHQMLLSPKDLLRITKAETKDLT